MKLFITRHGETDWNVQEKVCGSSESILTKKGHEQAASLALRLAADKLKNNIQTIYVSPLKRAVDTAGYIEKALGIKAVRDKRIKEVSFGSLEGMSWKDPIFLAAKENPFAKFPGGESFLQAAHRSYSLIDELIQKSKTGSLPSGNILFVCHGMISRIMATYFRDFTPEELNVFRMENCQLLEFKF